MSLKRGSLPFTTITSAVVDTSPTGLKLASLKLVRVIFGSTTMALGVVTSSVLPSGSARGNRRGADHAAGTGPVIDDDVAAEALLQRRGDGARHHVQVAARGERHDQRDRLVGQAALRAGRHDIGGDAERKHLRQQGSAFHHLTPFRAFF